MDPFELMGKDPYSLRANEKAPLFDEGMRWLIKHHYERCLSYRRLLDGLHFSPEQEHSFEEMPFVPVRLFKTEDLRSVSDEEVAKTMTSSGTSGQAVSKIYLSKENVRLQTKALTYIITSFIGNKRLPLLILDSDAVRKDRKMYSARGAGITGFLTFGRDVVYALDAEMNLKTDEIKRFVDEHNGMPILMFGYTYMIWQYVIRELEKASLQLGINAGYLFHIGGWKKLVDQAVSASEFNARAQAALGAIEVYNYYGMAEQLGSVFVECEHGHMHCSNYSEVLVRDPASLAPCDIGQRGFLELASLLPVSYPGHILLTEDEGEILGEDDCPCGRFGRYFKIHGRIKGAEIRGCSDTYERN